MSVEDSVFGIPNTWKNRTTISSLCNFYDTTRDIVEFILPHSKASPLTESKVELGLIITQGCTINLIMISVAILASHN